MLIALLLKHTNFNELICEICIIEGKSNTDQREAEKRHRRELVGGVFFDVVDNRAQGGFNHLQLLVSAGADHTDHGEL